MSALTEQEFKERWSTLHGGAAIKGAVAGWLSFSYQAARVCTALKFTPNFLTLLGLATAVAMAFSTSAGIALVLLTVSLFFDGIDGSVAIVQGRESKWGAVLDSIADRISEARSHGTPSGGACIGSRRFARPSRSHPPAPQHPPYPPHHLHSDTEIVLYV